MVGREVVGFSLSGNLHVTERRHVTRHRAGLLSTSSCTQVQRSTFIVQAMSSTTARSGTDKIYFHAIECRPKLFQWCFSATIRGSWRKRQVFIGGAFLLLQATVHVLPPYDAHRPSTMPSPPSSRRRNSQESSTPLKRSARQV